MSKQTDVSASAAPTFQEIQERLVHIEIKIDKLISYEGSAAQFAGHADQRFGHITYSQHGEDLLFVNVFDQLRISKPTYVDIGAHHPLNCSNTALLYERGGRGVNVDANPDFLPEFERLRPEDININIGVGPSEGVMSFYRIDALSGRNTFSHSAAEQFIKSNPQFKITDTLEIKVVTLNVLIDDYCKGVMPDLLSIDAEGLDYLILKNATFPRGRPRILCVEKASAAGGFGRDISMLLQTRGFVPYVQMGENLIFLERDAASLLWGSRADPGSS